MRNVTDALNTGELENLIREAASNDVDHLRCNLFTNCMDALHTGQLKNLVQDSLSGHICSHLEPEIEITLFTKHSALKQPATISTVPDFHAVSALDRRIGELQGMIRNIQRLISERTGLCASIEEQLCASRAEFDHLVLDIEWHKNLLKHATGRAVELEATQKKLSVQLARHRAAMQHALIDTEAYTARSDLSDAILQTSISAMGYSELCYTPRTTRRHLRPLTEG